MIFFLNVFLFSTMYLISFHLVMSGDDWFLVWLGLEVNMMIFIVLMFSGSNIMSMECCLKYFFIQSLGSAIFMGIFYLGKSLLDIALSMLLSYKMGAGPFFFWFPSVSSGVSWVSCFVLMTFQKIMPLMLVGMFISWVLYFIVIASLIFGVFGSFNQTDLKQLIAYSSVYHLGWILLCMMCYDTMWMSYLLMYMLMVFPVMNFLMWLNVTDLASVVKMKYKNWFIILMLSMSGMPPFLGFFLKWFAFMMIFKYEFFYMMFLVICSVVMFYVYFRVIFDVIIGFCMKMFWSNIFLLEKKTFYFGLITGIGFLFGLITMVVLLF